MVALFGATAGCQKVSFRSPPLGAKSPEVAPETPVAGAPVPVVQRLDTAAPPPPPGPQTEPPAPIPGPDPKPSVKPPLRADFLRFETDSWFKVCFWVTLDGKSSEQTFIGCNKGPKLIGSVPSIDLSNAGTLQSADKCHMVGVKAEVYRNTENCLAPTDCQDATYGTTASFTRSTKAPAGPGLQPAMAPFIVRLGGDGSFLDPRVGVTPELRKAEDEWNATFNSGKVPTDKKVVRVFFEDQADEGFAQALAPGSNWRQLGIDFNDAVFDISLPADGEFGFEGTSLACNAKP